MAKKVSPRGAWPPQHTYKYNAWDVVSLAQYTYISGTRLVQPQSTRVSWGRVESLTGVALRC